jgi:large subunit ribosomal protein L21
MFAVIKTGGKQYKVQEGDVLQVEKLSLKEGEKVMFDQVLLIDDDENTLIGTPFLKNVLVKAEVMENFKDKKVIIFKKKRRKQYKKKIGHRQELTRVQIKEIVLDLKAAPKKEPAKPKAKEKKVPPKAKLKKEVKEAKKEESKKKVEPKAAKKEPKVVKKTRATKTEKPKAKASTKKKVATKAAPKAKKS